MANKTPTITLTEAQFDAIEVVDVPAGTEVLEAANIVITDEKRSFLQSARVALDKAAGVIAKNKVVAAALVSLFAVAGVVSTEDAATWTNIATAIATVVSAVL